MEKILEMIENPPKKYRPVPFWSWNTKLSVDETRWQIREMKRVGFGGYFMHARGGLKTEYLGKEWMDNVSASLDEGEKNSMNTWGYDENGWPSGFGNDKVNSLGLSYVQKYLRCSLTDNPVKNERTIINLAMPSGKNAHFYYDVNEFYVDTLNGMVTEEFIKSTHEKYKQELGDNFKKMSGFFTDEPQISRNGIPWSFILPEEYETEYGEDLLSRLCDLFFDTDGCQRTRFRFWKLVSRLFSENYMGKIYSWCEENGVSLTGHMVIEENLAHQIQSNGAVMPNYEYLHIPGIDKLGLSTDRDLLTSQVCSVAAQLGKKQILTESFACCGWDVSFEEMRRLFEWQAVRGVNLLCYHLSGYSLEGIRKRDYPAGHFYQNPSWEDYKYFNGYVSRIGMLLSEGTIESDVLVLHTVSSGWINYKDNPGEEMLQKYHSYLTGVMTELDKHQILFHLGDDRILKKYANVNGKSFCVGNMSYSAVIVPSSENIDENTLSLIERFCDNGGKLVFVGNVPEFVDGVNSDRVKELAKRAIFAKDEKEVAKLVEKDCKRCKVVDEFGNDADIQYALRKFSDFDMYYFVNTFSERTNATITLFGKSACLFDALTGKNIPIEYSENAEEITFKHTFEKSDSAIFFVRKDEKYESKTCEMSNENSINELLYGTWSIEKQDKNLLTLDRCDVYFDGELVEKNMYVCDIQEIACKKQKSVKIALDFDVNCDCDMLEKEMYLVIENPQNYKIYVNGKIVEKRDAGFCFDKSFRKIDLCGKFEKGYNILTLECDFVQSEKVYDDVANCKKFESVRNKLYYDMEIEPVYLLGDFSVKSSQPFLSCQGDGTRTEGKFCISQPVKDVKCGDIAWQGFPFFAGKMTLKKTFALTKDECCGRYIEFSRLCGVVTKIYVNGAECKTLLWAPYKVSFDGLVKEGENTVEIEITSSLRNMLGPHHLGYNKKLIVPGSFMNKSEIWPKLAQDKLFDDAYSFSGAGLFLK